MTTLLECGCLEKKLSGVLELCWNFKEITADVFAVFENELVQTFRTSGTENKNIEIT